MREIVFTIKSEYNNFSISELSEALTTAVSNGADSVDIIVNHNATSIEFIKDFTLLDELIAIKNDLQLQLEEIQSRIDALM